MPCDVPLHFYTTEDGEPWALFAWGKIHKCNFTVERCVEAIRHYGGLDEAEALELVGQGIEPGPLWIREDADADEDDGYRYRFCQEVDDRAQRITGWRFL